MNLGGGGGKIPEVLHPLQMYDTPESKKPLVQEAAAFIPSFP